MSIPADLVARFTPAGTLRASINLGNPILASRDAAGEPCGVSVDLARAFAQRLGVGLELVVFETAGKSVQAVPDEQADIGFFALDPLRGEGISFTAPAYSSESSGCTSRRTFAGSVGRNCPANPGSCSTAQTSARCAAK